MTISFHKATCTQIAAGFAGRSFRFISLLGCLLCLLGLGTTALAQSSPVLTVGGGIITTIAGVYNSFGQVSEGNNGPALQTDLAAPQGLLTDASGNVYFVDPGGNDVRILYVGGVVPPLLKFQYGASYNYMAGYTYVIAGDNVTYLYCAESGPSTCGDGNLAIQASLNSPASLAFDSKGSLYIADYGSQTIRKIDITDGKISTIAGDPMHFTYGSSGDAGPADKALLYGPNSLGFDANGNLYLSDSNNLTVRKIDGDGNISTIAGMLGVFCSTAPCGDGDAAVDAQFGYVGGIFIDPTGDIYVTDQGAATIRRIDAETAKIDKVAGTFFTSCIIYTDPVPTCGNGSAATSALLNNPSTSYLDAQGNLYVVDTADNVVRVVDKTGNINPVIGHIYNPSGGGFYTGDGGPANQAGLSGPSSIAFDPNGVLYVADSGNSLIRQVVPLKSQTVTFASATPTTATYGQSPITLSATATDSLTGAATGLSVTFSVTKGPGRISGSVLTVAGVGTIMLQASVAGNSTYAPATQTANIAVDPATLTVTAQDATLKQGGPLPSTFNYTITGFVSPDTLSIVTGAPTFEVKDSNGTVVVPASVPALGSYTIVPGEGTLAAGSNYQFSFVDGKLLVSTGATQTVAFSSYTPPTVYGGANSTFTFSLTVSPATGLPVTVTPTGLIKLQQLSDTMWSATVTGGGQVTLTALLAGDDAYASATASTQFVVGPAALTIPLNSATRIFGAPNPMFSYGTPVGFIGTDNSSMLIGAPAYTTNATATSDPGTYTIKATQGTLFSPNYTFTFMPATLTITQATQQITNLLVPFNISFGETNNQLQAKSTSGLPIVYAATGAVQINFTSNAFDATGIGPATITATQAGNLDYASVSATVDFTVAPELEYITAYADSVPYGSPLPQLHWCVGGLTSTGIFCSGTITLSANLYTGAPALSTAAAKGSPTGTYPINVSAGTLTSPVYNFVYVPGTFTIIAPSTYTLSVNPSSITVPNGQSRQATITVTPVNNFAGTVTFACSGLPAGVTCISSPASLTTTLNAVGNSMPVSGTLTISAGQVVAQNTTGNKGHLLAAGVGGLPGILLALLLFYRRRKFERHAIFTGMLVLVALAMSIACVTACGGGSSQSSSGPQPGTAQITITATGTGSAGALSQTVGLTVTIQ